MSILLQNGRIYYKGQLIERNILIEDGRIKEITEKDNVYADFIVNCVKKIILPGIIDCHVHFRVPGNENKEDWNTGSKAALHGGVTTVVDMPNNNPAITTLNALEKKREIVGKEAMVNYAFMFGAGNSNLDDIMYADVPSVKVIMGETTGELLVEGEENIRNVFAIAKESGKLVCIHAEDQETIKKNIKKAKVLHWDSARYHGKVRNREAAIKAVKQAIEITREVGNKLHVCHVTTKEELELIKEAKEDGLQITCECTPHHLFLNESHLFHLKNFGKVNPPLRTEEDNEALWEGIQNNIIDIIATDHAPHAIDEKKQDYWNAPAGMPGIETLFPLMFTQINEENLSLEKFVELLSEKPAKIFGFESKGKIEEGFDADIIIVNPEKEHEINTTELQTKCGWTPFNGTKVVGSVDMAIVNGNLVYDRGKFNEEFLGREIGRKQIIKKPDSYKEMEREKQEAMNKEKKDSENEQAEEDRERQQGENAMGEEMDDFCESKKYKEVAEILFDIEAVKINVKKPFRYTSGILSPIYTDNRLLISYPKERDRIIKKFMDVIAEKGIEFDVVAGTASAAIPHAAWLAEKYGKPMVYIRKKSKQHGARKLIEGKIEKGQKVLLVEDLISTGGSSIAGVEALREEGAIVDEEIAIFTYNLTKSKENFKNAKVKLITLTDFETALNVAMERDYLNEKEVEIAKEWNKNSVEWGRKMGYER